MNKVKVGDIEIESDKLEFTEMMNALIFLLRRDYTEIKENKERLKYVE